MPRHRSPVSLGDLALASIASYLDDYWLADPEWWNRTTHKDGFLVVLAPFIQHLIDHLTSSKLLKYHHLSSLIDPRLERLDLSRALNLLTDAEDVNYCVFLVGTRCKKMTVLSLAKVRDILPSGMEGLVKSLPLLTHLNLGGTKANNDVVSLLGESCPNLVNLNLQRCPVSDVGIINMCVSTDENVRKCKKLVKIDLTRAYHCSQKVTAVGAEALLSNAPNIQHILGVYELCEAVYNLYCDNEERPVPADQQLELRSISYHKHLPSVLLRSYMEVCVAYCPHITEVRLSGSTNEASLYQVSSLPLTVLKIHSTREMITFTGGLLPVLERVGRDLLELMAFVKDLDLGAVANLCPKLKVLCVWIGYNDVVHSLPVYSVFSNLETLILNCAFIMPPVPVEQLSPLQNCPNLQELVLTLVKSHTDELLHSILQINLLPGLTKLKLENCYDLSEEGLKRLLQSCNELEKITLQACDITPDGCEKLSQYIRENNFDTTIETST